MGFTAAGISPTTVTTTQQCPLGFVLTAPCSTADAGMCEWVYVFNDAASDDFAVGTIVFRDPSATTQDWYGALPTGSGTVVSRPYVIGVAQHAIPAGSYGFVLKRGVGLILSGSAGVAVDTEFTSGGDAIGAAVAVVADADATVDTHNAVIGHVATAIGASTTGTAFIDCAG